MGAPTPTAGDFRGVRVIATGTVPTVKMSIFFVFYFIFRSSPKVIGSVVRLSTEVDPERRLDASDRVLNLIQNRRHGGRGAGARKRLLIFSAKTFNKFCVFN